MVIQTCPSAVYDYLGQHWYSTYYPERNLIVSWTWAPYPELEEQIRNAIFGGLQQERPRPVPQPPPAPGRPLPGCVKSRLRPYFSAVNLDDIRIQEGIPDYVVGNPDAYTEGNRIYFKKGKYDPHSVWGLADVGHEITHSEQYARLGASKFQAKYLAEYAAGRALGLDHQTAYESISFEVEARKKADMILKDLQNQMRDFGGRDPCPR